MIRVKNIYTLLRKKYPASEYALMEEVSDAAGFYRSNSADYIVVNLWPSRGLGINGIELKSFRGDWLSELKKPKKAENIFQYCDYFWLLTIDDTIAKLEEIPITWGWMCVNGSKIVVKKDAPKLTPISLDKHFMVAMLKRAVDKTNFVHIDSIQDKIEDAKKAASENSTYQAKRDAEELKDLKKAIKEFEEASGIEISNRWYSDNKKAGAAVKFIANGGVDDMIYKLKVLKTTSEQINKSINSALDIELFNNQPQEKLLEVTQH